MQTEWEHTGTELLRAYFERRVLDPEASAIAEHLEGCGTCSGRYLALLLRESGQNVRVPDEIWPGIQTRLSASTPVRYLKRAWGVFSVLGFATALALILAMALPLFHRRLFTHPNTTLQMGQYLAVVEQTTDRSGVARLRAQFAEFAPYDRRIALIEGRVNPQVENYRLVDQVGQHSGAVHEDVIQLLYDSGTDTFALFVAPRGSILNFDKYELTGAEVGGRQCQRVTCPREDVYVWTGRGHDYVFVRRHSSSISSERLFAELMQGVS